MVKDNRAGNIVPAHHIIEHRFEPRYDAPTAGLLPLAAFGSV